MNEHFKSLDETVATIKAECETRVKAAEDKALASNIEATLCKNLLKEANETRDMYARVAERLITQFSTVERVFADAKAYAMAIPKKEEPEADHPLLPKVTMGDSNGHS